VCVCVCVCVCVSRGVASTEATGALEMRLRFLVATSNACVVQCGSRERAASVDVTRAVGESRLNARVTCMVRTCIH
jgi:hypothetical protein